jgi:signal transduction histidine kinase
MIKEVTRSLSARLVAVFFVTSLVYGFGAVYAVRMVRETDYLREIVGSHISLHADLVLKEIGTPPDPAKAKAIVDRIPVDIRISSPGVQWSSSPDFPDLKTIPFGPIAYLDLDHKSERDIESWAQGLERVRFARFQGHIFAELKEGPHVVVFASPRLAESPPPDLTGPVMVLFSLLVLSLCFLAVRWLVRPIKWIQAGTSRIGQGDLDYRIETSRRDDLGDLAKGINHVADDVRDMLEAKRQLLLAISHELRSPLTRAKVALEFLEDDQVKRNLLDDIREMERLIADLLESERMNVGHTTLRRSLVDLCAMLADLIRDEFQAQTDRIELKLPSGVVVREVDEVRMRLVAKNLIENALRYTPPDAARVEVGLTVKPGMVLLQIRDHGPGISREHLPKISQPFYRADPARCRSTGGLGLGLYLARRIAEAHNGSLVIESELGYGTLVTVTIPDFVAAQDSAYIG